MGRQIYGALVRFGGTAMLLLAVFDAIHIALKLLGVDYGSKYPIVADVYGAILYFVLGAGILLGARGLERIAYGPGSRRLVRRPNPDASA